MDTYVVAQDPDMLVIQVFSYYSAAQRKSIGTEEVT